MSEKKISPGLKSALDLGPVVLFFLAFFFLKADTYTVGGREYGKFIVERSGLDRDPRDDRSQGGRPGR